jgi:hypothetical protein
MGIYLSSRERGWLWMYVISFSSFTTHSSIAVILDKLIREK